MSEQGKVIKPKSFYIKIAIIWSLVFTVIFFIVGSPIIMIPFGMSLGGVVAMTISFFVFMLIVLLITKLREYNSQL